jgi:hypothetical protein
VGLIGERTGVGFPIEAVRIRPKPIDGFARRVVHRWRLPSRKTQPFIRMCELPKILK